MPPTQRPPARVPEVFISYARSDGADFALQLRKRLEAEGVALWQDRVGMEGGRDWWLQIVEALEQVRFMLLVITPKAVKSETVRKEWRQARQKGVCVYPVVGSRDLDFARLPRWMRQVHFYDLDAEWETLLNDLRKTPQRVRVPFMAGDLPKDFVPRRTELERLRGFLHNAEQQEPVAATVALLGAGGFGKTTLARALCHDEQIQEAFDDGVLWVTLGEAPGNLTSRVEDLIEYLSGDRPGFAGIDAALARFRDLLADRDVLLVIDDVWNPAELSPFLEGGARCARLVTTRNLDTLPPHAKRVRVDLMKDNEAVKLLGYQLPTGCDGELRQLAVRLGEWPLLLKLVNRSLLDRIRFNFSLSDAIQHTNDALNRRGLVHFDSREARSRDEAVAKTITVSLDQLSADEQRRFAELSVFPSDIAIPMTAVERLWKSTGGLDEFETEALLLRLGRLSLLADLDLTLRQFRLHNIIQNYLALLTQDRLAGIHVQLLEAHRPEGDGTGVCWSRLSPDEPYLWEMLAHHLAGAKLDAELMGTVRDPAYLCAKAYHRGSSSVEDDIMVAERLFPAEAWLPELRLRLAHCGHLLNRCDSFKDLQTTFHVRVHSHQARSPAWSGFLEMIPGPWLAATKPPPDLSQPGLIRTLAGHQGRVTDCCFSPDGRFIMSASEDETLKMWDVKTGREIRTFFGRNGPIKACVWSPKGDAVIAASGDGTFQIWDPLQAVQIRSLKGHHRGLRSCAFNRDGSIFVSAAADGTLKSWETEGWEKLLTLSGHRAGVNDCAVAGDGKLIVSASADGTLKVWDARLGQEAMTLEGHGDWVRACAISSDGSILVSASDDRTLKTWDLKRGREIQTLTGHQGPVSDCVISGDGLFILSASQDRSLIVWETHTGALLKSFLGHKRGVNRCAVSMDNKLIVSAGDDSSVKMWDNHASLARAEPAGHRDWVRACAISADGAFMMSASDDSTLRMWDSATGREMLSFVGHEDRVRGCAISRDSRRIASVSDDHTLKIWDGASGRILMSLSGHRAGVNECAISPDGRRVATASDDRTVRIWDIENGKEIFKLVGHRGAVNSCAFNPDGSQVISASDDQVLLIWSLDNGQVVQMLPGHKGIIWKCAVSSRGERLVSASDDHTLIFWDAITGLPMHTLQGHEHGVNGCAIEPRGRLVASTSRDGTLKLWDIEAGTCVNTLYTEDWLGGCIFHPDGSRLLAWGGDGLYHFEVKR